MLRRLQFLTKYVMITYIKKRGVSCKFLKNFYEEKNIIA